MEVLFSILVGIIIVGGLYRIVSDEIRSSRQADRVIPSSPPAKVNAAAATSSTAQSTHCAIGTSSSAKHV